MTAGRPVDALPLLQEADRFWSDFDPHNRWAGEAALWLGRCYVALGRRSQTRPALSQASRILSRSPISTDAKLLQLAQRQ